MTTKQLLFSALILGATGNIICMETKESKILEKQDAIFQKYLSIFNDPSKISNSEFQELNHTIIGKFDDQDWIKFSNTESLADFSNNHLRNILNLENDSYTEQVHQEFKNIISDKNSNELNAVNCGYLFTFTDYNGKNIKFNGILYNTKNQSLCPAWAEYLKKQNLADAKYQTNYLRTNLCIYMYPIKK